MRKNIYYSLIAITLLLMTALYIQNKHTFITIQTSTIKTQNEIINTQKSLIEKQKQSIENQKKKIQILEKNIEKKKEPTYDKSRIKSKVFMEVAALIDEFNSTQKTKINKSFMLKLIKHESSFDPMARNRSGASGLCQMMPGTYRSVIKKYKIEDNGIMDIRSNVFAGLHYVQGLLETNNYNYDRVLIHYLGTYSPRYISMVKNANITEI